MCILTSSINILFCVVITILFRGINSSDVTFEELEELNIKCYDQNSCFKRTNLVLKEATDNFACHCGPSCSTLGTCCLDSPFRHRNRMSKTASCRSLNPEGNYFMIDKCSSSDDENLKYLCEEEQYSENAFMSRIPVTSLSSEVTYKNYFCLKCHETNGDYIIWNAEMRASIPFNSSDNNLNYSKWAKKWLAKFPVEIKIGIPSTISNVPKMCFQNLISSCSSDWPEDKIRQKCSIYTSVICIEKYCYRNPHCALCNFKNLEMHTCGSLSVGLPKVSKLLPRKHINSYSDYSTSYKRTSVRRKSKRKTRTLKNKMCHQKDHYWDRDFKTCIKVKCHNPEDVIKNGKCVKKRQIAFVCLYGCDTNYEKKNMVWNEFLEKWEKPKYL